jgi:hypothetical protein
MRFFSNKISVNNTSRSFNDIISDVAGGMKKQASVAAEPAEMTKEAKKGELPAFIKEKIEEREGEEGAKPAKKGKKGKVPAAFLAQQGKKAEAADIVKVADVVKVSDDEVLLVLAEGDAPVEMEVDIEDDATDEAMLEAMGTVANEACGYSEGAVGDSGCEACGTAMAGSDMESEAGWGGKEASASPKFVKIANLTDKQKGKFRSYWSNVWPKDFIDAVLETEN